MKNSHQRSLSGFLLLIVLWVPSCVTTQNTSPQAVKEDQIVTEGPIGILSQEERNRSKALAHYVNGLLHLSKGETSEALSDWEKVITLDPSRLDIREKLALEYFGRKEFKKAANILEVATHQKPDLASCWIQLAIAYRYDKQWDKAMQAAERAIHLEPSQLPAYEVLFEVFLELQTPEKAAKILHRAAQQKVEDFNFWLRLADLHTVLGAREPKFSLPQEEMIGFYNHALSLQPNDPIVLGRVADFYYINNEIPKAIELYQQVLNQLPHAEDVRRKLALCYISQGNKKLAIETLEQIAQHEPLSYQIFINIGELYEEMQDSEKAIHNYHLSLSANPKQLTPYLKIVLLHMRNKQIDEALRELLIAKEKFPSTPQISYFYGLVYSEAKDYIHAIESFENAKQLATLSTPEMLDGVFHFYYGSALERNGQFDQAVGCFTKAIEMNPDYADAYNYLGFMYADRNVHVDEAIRLIEKAVAYEPENGAFLDSLGWAYYRKGKLQDALSYLQHAAQIIGNDPIICEHLGDIYREMGKQTEAIEQYQKAVAIDPSNQEIIKKLEGIRRALSSTAPISNPAPVAR